MTMSRRAHTTGDVLFETMLPPTGRARVAQFSQATEDPNPIHVDDAFAARAGFKTVLQQGPMTTAQFARLLSDVVGAAALRVLDVTFTAPVYPEHSLTLRAAVTVTTPRLVCALAARKADGTETARGVAELEVG